MVVPISLPKLLQSLDVPDASPLEYVESSSVTSEGISDLISEKFSTPRGYASKDKRIRSKIQQKIKVREDLSNDIQSHRELVSRGKVGNRRRKRYENANFLNVPNSQPPLPSDWEVYPTYPVYHNVPYYLAPLWDSKFQRISEERTKSKSFTPHGKVSQDLKLALKKAKGAIFLLQHLEDEVRKFIQGANDERAAMATYRPQEEIDTEDEDIVFIGRDKDGKVITISDEKIIRPTEQPLQTQKLIFETKPQDGGGFMRWLIHELAEYYGLKSYKESYYEHDKEYIRIILLGFWGHETEDFSNSLKKPPTDDGIFQMPRPLWGLV